MHPPHEDLDLAHFRELLSSSALNVVNQAIELLRALDEPSLWQALREGVRINEASKVVLDESCRFKGAAHGTHVALWVLNKTGALKGLETIDLSYCRSLTNLDALSGCTQLRTLNLRGCDELTNLDALSGCTQLTTLHLSECDKLTNIDALSGCTQLTTLHLYGCKALTNLDGLSGCTQLTTLQLSYCRSLTNLDGLSACTQLTSLDLRSCTSLPESIRRYYGSRPEIIALLESL